MYKIHEGFDRNSIFIKNKKFSDIEESTQKEQISKLKSIENTNNENNQILKVTQKPKKRDKRLGRLIGGPSHLNIYYTHHKLPPTILYRTEDSVREVELEDSDCFPLSLPKSLPLHPNHPHPPNHQHPPLPLPPPPLICVHPMHLDTYISFELQRDGIWEKEMVSQFIELLLSEEDMMVYDVGANIGLYSLIGASMGHRVVAVEPVKANVVRLHQAIKANGFEDKITVVQNAVLNYRTTLEMDVPSDNQGGGKLSALDADRFCVDLYICPNHAQTILLNDLLDVNNGRKAMLKIDVEGMEHRAMRISRMLFKEVVVLYVMMEWREVRKYYGSYEEQNEDKTYVDEMIEMMVARGYEVECVITGKKLSVQHWYGWPDNVLWRLKKH